MSARFIDWIWHIKGSLTLAPGQSSDDAFERLRPLFREVGTTHERKGDTLVFRKKDQAAQDKMSVFDGGTLRIESGSGASVLHYHLTSRVLLLCFLAPLLFLGFAQMNLVLAKFDKPLAEELEKKNADKAEVPMHSIDKFLGAPAPEKKDEAKDKSKDKEKDKKKRLPTPGYVFAGIFAALYVVGRILEQRLVRSLFRKNLMEPQEPLLARA
ncbi:hypothetical protein GR702_16505 [Novosphingobium sp. FGD1]|uniref:Uncharacterized protein n=1 Tax=Novosphingobium silvae TaxID=2692619 RepID=A0A7X4GIQ3_9SPHN|nr:hypothetical protein [Novosphingobium silvae]MYL99371.1 hypothetical protein [Novosphingobium silvae]